MHVFVNGRRIPVDSDSDVELRADSVKRQLGIPGNRVLIEHLPDGSNRMINPGEPVRLSRDSSFAEVARATRGA